MWVYAVGTFLYLDIQYLNDPGWDLNDEHQDLYTILTITWGMLFLCYMVYFTYLWGMVLCNLGSKMRRHKNFVIFTLFFGFFHDLCKELSVGS